MYNCAIVDFREINVSPYLKHTKEASLEIEAILWTGE